MYATTKAGHEGNVTPERLPPATEEASENAPENTVRRSRDCGSSELLLPEEANECGSESIADCHSF